MNKIFYAIGTFAAALTLLASCDEWEPVFTGDYGKADVYKPVTLTPNKTILELKSLYKNAPVKIEDGIIIGGQVISEDRSGNIYKSISRTRPALSRSRSGRIPSTMITSSASGCM